MPKRAFMSVLVGLMLVGIVASGAWAQHAPGSGPQGFGLTPVFRGTFSVETGNGEVYHQNSQETGGTSCTASATDDAGSDNGRECYNSRDQLKAKNITAAEGGAATCQLAPGASQAGVVFDGVWVDQCTPSDTRGRVYTGVAVAGAGNGGVGAGGDAATQSGCVQAVGEDDTSGNFIKLVTDSAQNAQSPGSHTGSDDDSDVSLCGDVL